MMSNSQSISSRKANLAKLTWPSPRLKKEIEKKGGKITHEYNLIKGFAYVFGNKLVSCYVADRDSVTFSDDAVSTFESNPLVGNVEKDSEMHTQ